MQALRYIAAKGRHKAIVVYWEDLEAGKYNSVTKEIAWKKYNGEKLPGLSLRYLIRFALVDVATGEWATYSPVNTELMAVPLSGKTDDEKDMTEQQIAELKRKLVRWWWRIWPIGTATKADGYWLFCSKISATDDFRWR